ncbi:hypothetical protein BH23PLA1_BH23PLA1_03820 [soil metagenome]
MTPIASSKQYRKSGWVGTAHLYSLIDRWAVPTLLLLDQASSRARNASRSGHTAVCWVCSRSFCSSDTEQGGGHVGRDLAEAGLKEC